MAQEVYPDSSIDHGSQVGLGDDDHQQYLNSARHGVQDHTTAMSTVAIANIGDVTITGVVDNDLMAYDNGTGEWTNQSLSEVGAIANVAGVNSIYKLTQAQYDAIGTKDANTMYVIVG